jgi:hypothetical protein
LIHCLKKQKKDDSQFQPFSMTGCTQVEQRFLEALRPDQLILALAALARLEQEERAECKQWDLRLERARYEAKRAERQYQTVEPENRLVARSLERQWEDKLRAAEAVEKEYQTWSYRRRMAVTDADRESIVALGSDLPTRLPSGDHDQCRSQADAAPADPRCDRRRQASPWTGLGSNQLANRSP